MSKRAPVDLGDGHDAYMKRQKLSHGLKTANTQEEIQSGRQLQQLLAFDQDLARGKHGTYLSVDFDRMTAFRSSDGCVPPRYIISLPSQYLKYRTNNR